MQNEISIKIKAALAALPAVIANQQAKAEPEEIVTQAIAIGKAFAAQARPNVTQITDRPKKKPKLIGKEPETAAEKAGAGRGRKKAG